MLEIDAAANREVVGPGELLACSRRPRRSGDLYRRGAPLNGPFEAEVRLRHRGDDVPAVVEPLGDRVRVELRKRRSAGSAPGQSAVLDRGDELIGGGRIVDVLR